MRFLLSYFRHAVRAAVVAAFVVAIGGLNCAGTAMAQGSASLVLSTNDATPTFGQSITLAATLTITGSTKPSLGGFSIYDGSTALVAGAAANTVTGFVYATSSLAVGTHMLHATYAGALNGLTATSNTIVVQVSAATTGGPSITRLSPGSIAAGASGVTLYVVGGGYRKTSSVEWNGAAVTTTYISATELRASIPAVDIATPGAASITVVNPAPNGGTSAAAQFTIKGAIPAGDLFVSPSGNDANPGTISQPFLTIQKCATTAVSGNTCQVRAGTYRETVTPNPGVTITSYDGEDVTIDGSDPVTGWTLYKGSIYQARVTLSSGDTNQLFVGSEMMTEARWPNGNDLFHVNWATAGPGTTKTTVADSQLPAINWKGAKIHLWSGTDPWDPLTGTVTASSAGKLTFAADGASYPPYIQPQAGGYYYLFGILGALDTENEWVYNAKTGTLYFWAPGGVNPNKLNVRAKRRQLAFDLSGKSNVTIENLNLFASSVMMDGNSKDNTIDNINAQYISHFTSLPDVAGYPHSYWYDHTSDSGIVLGGSGNVLENSTIAYSAGNGAAILGANDIVRNNLIHHIGYMGNYCSGVDLNFSVGEDNRIEQNTIYAAGRFAIDPLGGQHEDMGYNNLFDAMMLSRDGGEIYAGGFAATGTRIHNNWIHDTQSLIMGAADNYPLAGIYLDEDTSGIEIDQNVIWNNAYYNLLLNYSNDGVTAPNDNYVHNNTVPDVNGTGTITTDLNTPCGTTRLADNRVLIPIVQSGTVCAASDNNANAPGADQMNASVQVGCNFAGCGFEGPPKISGSKVGASILIQPMSATAGVGSPAIFAVSAAGSAPIQYQWKKDGVNISGATSAVYTTPKLAAGDNGAIYTVEVSNAVGAAVSLPAILTVN